MKKTKVIKTKTKSTDSNNLTKDHFDKVLSNYITKEYLDKSLSNYVTKDYLDKSLSKYVTKEDAQEQTKVILNAVSEMLKNSERSILAGFQSEVIDARKIFSEDNMMRDKRVFILENKVASIEKKQIAAAI